MSDRPTSFTAAQMKRAAAKRARLVAAGLLNDHGHEIRLNDCPGCTYLGNYDSTDEAFCELPRGHEGSHRYVVEWDAE